MTEENEENNGQCFPREVESKMTKNKKKPCFPREEEQLDSEEDKKKDKEY